MDFLTPRLRKAGSYGLKFLNYVVSGSLNDETCVIDSKETEVLLVIDSHGAEFEHLEGGY